MRKEVIASEASTKIFIGKCREIRHAKIVKNGNLWGFITKSSGNADLSCIPEHYETATLFIYLNVNESFQTLITRPRVVCYLFRFRIGLSFFINVFVGVFGDLP